MSEKKPTLWVGKRKLIHSLIQWNTQRNLYKKYSLFNCVVSKTESKHFSHYLDYTADCFTSDSGRPISSWAQFKKCYANIQIYTYKTKWCQWKHDVSVVQEAGVIKHSASFTDVSIWAFQQIICCHTFHNEPLDADKKILQYTVFSTSIKLIAIGVFLQISTKCIFF